MEFLLNFFVSSWGELVAWWHGASTTDNLSVLALLIAILSALISYRSLYVQRKLAQQKAAVDVFVKTEMDDSMIQAYENFRKALHQLAKTPDMREFAETDEYRHIRNFLNIQELIAVGVHNKVFDRKVCHRYWGDILTRSCADARPVIDHAKAQPHGQYTYSDLERLNRNWSTPWWWRRIRFGY
jgi:hypothetical protein